MAKVSENKIAIRQSDVREMMLKGNSTSFIAAFIMNEYGVSKGTVERDITIIYRELRVYMEKAKEDIISEHIAKYDKIFADCMELSNFKDALKALKQKEELLKYHRNEPLIAIQNNTMNLEAIGSDELLKAIQELKKLQNGQ